MPAEQSEMPVPPKKHESMLKFGHSEQPQGPDIGGVINDVNTLSRRLRLLEESVTNLRRLFQVTEENMIQKNKHYSAEFKTAASDIMEIRKEIQDLKDKFQLMIKELQSVARREEVRVLEKYINLWNPIKFVTANEVEQVVNEILERKKDRKL